MGNIEKGSLSITSENIFPIIKKWLYSDHDIFLRELVSNACDAITKLKKLDGIGEWKAPEDNKYRADYRPLWTWFFLSFHGSEKSYHRHTFL